MKKKVFTSVAVMAAITSAMAATAMAEDYKVGIVQYVDDASLNQITENIEKELDAKAEELGVTFNYADYFSNAQADSSVLNYLSDAAQLQLNIPESDWPGGLTITVSNDLRTSVVCNSSAEVKTFATLAEERVIAADLQEKYGSLFTSLLGGEYTDVTDGGDSTIYGQPCSLFVKFAVDSFHYLLVSVDTDGNLLSLHETNRTVESLGEYTSVSRAEADKRLANGEFLTDSYTAEAVDPAAEPEHLANLRLTYVQSNATYYLPMWEYTIDEGPAALGDGDDVDQTLHTFAAYYVPAVELDEIDALKNK